MVDLRPILSRPRDVPYCLYIGAMRNTSTGLFQWNDGSDVTTTQWYMNEPNNFGGNENYSCLWATLIVLDYLVYGLMYRAHISPDRIVRNPFQQLRQLAQLERRHHQLLRQLPSSPLQQQTDQQPSLPQQTHQQLSLPQQTHQQPSLQQQTHQQLSLQQQSLNQLS
uniref:Uncharacterized protein LOC100179247 n=1 Tax=Phallusia mammillata TaxID=59560 RepID=A0A6F9DHN6_9ASCI|nr:uncharacterized protein LOC100179247 [Phallusia mammillata]